MTQDAINELIAKRVDEALKAYVAARNPETKAEIKNEQQDDHVKGDVNNGNGNGNGNGNPNVNNGGVVPVARELFHISNFPLRYQVKYASCTLMDGALTWWNSHKRTVVVDAAYAMTWKALMKLMAKVYCPMNEIQKTETELWNLTVKSNNLTAYNQRTAVAATPQRAPIGNQMGNTCYECRRPGHYRNECLKLRNQNHGNKTRNKTGNNEAIARAYAIGGGGGTNPDSNIITGTFLLNNRYASMLFNSGADRSFVLTTFSALLNVIPSTLDTSYAIELADGRILETNVILRGCTLDTSGSKSKLSIISCTKTQKYIQKGCEVYLAQLTTKKSDDEPEEK
ncbi:putative reverse transcriptase domain-containing protein [Tanacetum coccineum]